MNTFDLPNPYGVKYTFSIFFLIFSIIVKAQTVLYNNGNVARLNPGCIVFIQNGDVRNENGVINNAGRLIIEKNFINNDTATSGSSSGKYEIKGNFTNNQTFIEDQGEVTLNGTNQQITGSVVTSFYDLTLAGTGIKSQTLNARVKNTLKLNDRELSTGGNMMYVDNPSPLAITENGGFVSSTGSGRLVREMNQASSYLYPVGSSSGTPRIRPLNLTPSTTSGDAFAVRFANVDPSLEGFDRSLHAAAVCDINNDYYHLVQHTSGTSPARITMNYIASNDGSWAGIGHWQNNPQWQNTSNATQGTSGGYSQLTINSWSDFSYPAFSLINFGLTPTISFSGNILIAPSGGASYQWYHNDNPIPGATGQTHDALTTGSGTYYVEVTYPDGCKGNSPVIEFSPSGFEEIDGLKSFLLFPNPGSGQFTIMAEMEYTDDFIITFTDMIGRQIRPDISLLNVTNINEQIDLDEQPNGVYFINLHSNSGRKTIRYIKN